MISCAAANRLHPDAPTVSPSRRSPRGCSGGCQGGDLHLNSTADTDDGICRQLHASGGDRSRERPPRAGRHPLRDRLRREDDRAPLGTADDHRPRHARRDRQRHPGQLHRDERHRVGRAPERGQRRRCARGAPVFQDVPCPGSLADWIEELYAEAITGGCQASPLLYCPTSPVNRGQMATFLSKTFHLGPAPASPHPTSRISHPASRAGILRP